ELARARQAEADACDQVRQARGDAAREREVLAEQYQARPRAAEQLAAAEREHQLGLLAALTTAGGGEEDRPAPGSARAPASSCPRHGQGHALSARKSVRGLQRGRQTAPGRQGKPARASPPAPCRLDARTGKCPPAGWHARRFTSSLITVMIRKEGPCVRAMRLAPARQLTLDIPGPER